MRELEGDFNLWKKFPLDPPKELLEYLFHFVVAPDNKIETTKQRFAVYIKKEAK